MTAAGAAPATDPPAATPPLADALFRALVDVAQELVGVIGPDLRLRYVGRAGAARLGYDAAALRGRPGLEFVHPDDRQRAGQRLAVVLGQPERTELSRYRFVHADGSPREYETTATVLDVDGLRCLVLVGRDVTAQRQAELVAARGQERLQAALWAGRMGTWEWFPQLGYETHDPLASALDYRAALELGIETDAWTQCLHPDDQQPAQQSIERLLASGADVHEFEYRVRDGDGEWRWRLDRGQVVERDAQNRPVRVIGVTLDIDARKRLERELVEVTQREQQRLGRELHDGLGQELTGLALMLEAVSQQLAEARPALAGQMAKLTRLAAGAVQSARAIAHGLAPVSDEHGGLENALRRLVERLQDLHGTRLELDWRADEPRRLDPFVAHHLFHIAREAVNNAIRHGRARSVVVRVALLPRGTLQLEVIDDGTGLGESARSKASHGLRSMANRAGSIRGKLAIAPRPGGGTTVVVNCPLA